MNTAAAGLRVRQRLNGSEGRAVLIASHPRSGTHLMIDFIRRQFASCRGWRWWGLPLDYLYLNIERLIAEKRRFSDNLAASIIHRSRKPLLKTHAYPHFSDWWIDDEAGRLPEHWSEWISQRRATIYVYRDPRDVMVSYHEFMRGFTPSAECALPQFIQQPHRNSSYTRLQWWGNHVREWLKQPAVIKVRFEDLCKNPEPTMDVIGSAIGEVPQRAQPLLPTNIRNNQVSRLCRLAMLSPPSTAIIASHGATESWRAALSRQDRRYIHDEIGDLLVDLGYEQSASWINA